MSTYKNKISDLTFEIKSHKRYGESKNFYNIGSEIIEKRGKKECKNYFIEQNLS